MRLGLIRPFRTSFAAATVSSVWWVQLQKRYKLFPWQTTLKVQQEARLTEELHKCTLVLAFVGHGRRLLGTLTGLTGHQLVLVQRHRGSLSFIFTLPMSGQQ